MTKKVGLVLGSFAAVVHLFWVLLVAVGWAQPFMDFVYDMHFMSHSIEVEPFALDKAVGLVVLAFVIWYIFGNILGGIWRKFQ